MYLLNRLLILVLLVMFISCEKKLSEVELKQKANELAQKLTIIDTHIDAPGKLYHEWKNIADSTDRNFD